MPFGRKRNETGNQFEGLLGQGERLNNEVAMADLMVDMNTSVKNTVEEEKDDASNGELLKLLAVCEAYLEKPGGFLTKY